MKRVSSFKTCFHKYNWYKRKSSDVRWSTRLEEYFHLNAQLMWYSHITDITLKNSWMGSSSSHYQQLNSNGLFISLSTLIGCIVTDVDLDVKACPWGLPGFEQDYTFVAELPAALQVTSENSNKLATSDTAQPAFLQLLHLTMQWNDTCFTCAQHDEHRQGKPSERETSHHVCKRHV